jgi:8-oxoguanine deaminase
MRWGTAVGAQVLHLPELGTQAPGQASDVAMFDLEELRFSGSGDPVAALVLCGAHKVRHLMIGGEWRVSDGDLAGVDVARLRVRHQELADQLAARA